MELIVVTLATAVASVTGEHSAAFRRTYPRLPSDKFFTAPNGYDNGEWEESPAGTRREQESEEKFLIAYTVKFYTERDPQPLFRALRTLIDSGEIKREQVRVDLAGCCETSEGRSVFSAPSGSVIGNGKPENPVPSPIQRSWPGSTGASSPAA